MKNQSIVVRILSMLVACLMLISSAGCAGTWDTVVSEMQMMLGGEGVASSKVESAQSLPPGRDKLVRSSTSLRGSDLKGLDAVGELMEDFSTESGIAQEQDDTAFAWPLELMPYRAMLLPKEQAVYDEVYYNIAARKDSFGLSKRISVDRINDVVNAVYYDNPDFFWLDSSYRYSYNTKNEVMGLQISFNETASNYAASKQKFDAAADRLISEAKKLPRPIDQEKYVHDQLLNMVDYDLESPNNQSAYSALVGGRSVCAGYARAFQYVMMKLGIPCYYCVGVAGEDHAWNIIQLDGSYYNVDVSWDDPVGNPKESYNYDYFNLTDKQMEYDHQREELSVNLPACTAEKMGYTEVFGAASEQEVRKGGALPRYEDFGVSSEEILRTLKDYYNATYQQMMTSGQGKSTTELILEDKALSEQVYNAIDSKEWFNRAAVPAGKDLGLNGFSAGIEIKMEEIADGFYRLTQTITLESAA